MGGRNYQGLYKKMKEGQTEWRSVRWLKSRIINWMNKMI